MSNVKWAELLRMHWPAIKWAKTPEQERNAHEEMAMTVGTSLSNDELVEVIRWMAGPEGRQKHAPSLRQLVMSIYTYRKRGTGGADDGAVIGCELCATTDKPPKYGWVYPQTTLHARHFMAVPCVCEAGRWVVEKCEPYLHYDANQLRNVERIRQQANQAVTNGTVMLFPAEKIEGSYE